MSSTEARVGLIRFTGPAHAVYFATYEAVKQAMGGNDRNSHHPVAAGKSLTLGERGQGLKFN